MFLAAMGKINLATKNSKAGIPHVSEEAIERKICPAKAQDQMNGYHSTIIHVVLAKFQKELQNIVTEFLFDTSTTGG
jgi:hypothetical protein